MKALLAFVAAAALILPAEAGRAQGPGQTPVPGCGRVDQWPGESWGQADPSSAGWNTARLAEAEALFESLDSAAVMVVHRGKLVAAWGSVETPYTAQSVRKALLNGLIGGLVDRGMLSTEATLASLGIDDTNPALTPEERQATVEDLMRSRSGIFHSALYEVGGWKRERAALAARKLAGGGFGPGEYWIYNNWDFNALGTIVERTAGLEIGPLFARFVAAPLHMQDFEAGHVEYTTKESATEQRFQNWSEHRAYVFDISTRDLARYGLMYMGCGVWNGQRLLSADWIRRSLEGVDTRLGRGPDEQATGFGDYGYLWQIDRPGSRRLSRLQTREPVYMATGARGHFMLIAPYLDLVIAHQVATVGGVGPEAQQRRPTEGSPEVREADLERLFAAIIAAHPDGDTALGGN